MIISKKVFIQMLMEWRPSNLKRKQSSEHYIINEEKADKIIDSQTFLYYDLKNIAIIFDCICTHNMLALKEVGNYGVPLEIQHVIKLLIQRLKEDQNPIKRIVIEGFFKILTITESTNSCELLSNILIVFGEDIENSKLISQPIRCFNEKYCKESPENRSNMVNSLCLATTQLVAQSNISSNNDLKILKIANEVLPLLSYSDSLDQNLSDSKSSSRSHQLEYLKHIISLIDLNNDKNCVNLIVPKLLPLISLDNMNNLPHHEYVYLNENCCKVAKTLANKYIIAEDKLKSKIEENFKQSQEYSNIIDFITKIEILFHTEIICKDQPVLNSSNEEVISKNKIKSGKSNDTKFQFLIKKNENYSQENEIELMVNTKKVKNEKIIDSQ